MNLYDRRWADGDEGLREMCDRGVELLGELPQYEQLKLECFNDIEAEYVKAYMGEKHPGVPFFVTHIVFRDSDTRPKAGDAKLGSTRE